MTEVIDIQFPKDEAASLAIRMKRMVLYAKMYARQFVLTALVCCWREHNWLTWVADDEEREEIGQPWAICARCRKTAAFAETRAGGEARPLIVRAADRLYAEYRIGLKGPAPTKERTT